ncbi:universal stress protein [Emcibacter sp. SYSU 3D8]|uniref:universal stress protein n=1 Tax=Emcibacter sp. SYSU 3D8 TaxID=3133969 RepID=UPI0031FEFF5F
MHAAQPAAEAVTESRKFLVVVDQTPECDNAMRYAARRAAKTASGVILLFVVARPEFQQFAGIEQRMREEAHAEAQQVLRELATRLKSDTGIEAELVVREGTPAQEILKLVSEDAAIHVLVLAAGSGKDGPGPLVSSFSGQLAGTTPIPVTIVPGHLDLGQVDRIA